MATDEWPVFRPETILGAAEPYIYFLNMIHIFLLFLIHRVRADDLPTRSDAYLTM